MPLFDFECKTCETVQDDFFFRSKNAVPPICLSCGKDMTRKPSVASFAVKGFCAKNGYAAKYRVKHIPKESR